ncbi:MAG: DUF2818 family protein [Betaproteobacteria bacterium]|jgi:hypothetical protein|nr:DUF2818 family protein [Betaproteobacteria bacterium]
MSVTLAAVLWLLVGCLLANLPFVLQRRFGFLNGEKTFAFRLLELLLGYGLTLGFGLLLEGRLGAVQSQTWNFYAMTALLFLVMAYPGYVYRHLLRRRSGYGAGR